MNIQAEELNNNISAINPHIVGLLSKKGREIFHPKSGIISQSAEAKDKGINATIGIALEEDGSPMRFTSLSGRISLDPRKAFPYAPSYGRDDFRKEWQKGLYGKNPGLAGREISLPLPASGLTHALHVAGYMFIDLEDEIILPDLSWENYSFVFGLSFGAKFISYPLFKDKGFNTEGLKAALESGKPGKKIVILNFPNNPTGYSPTVEEAKRICQILALSADKGNSIVVIIDDAYFGLFYEDSLLKESIFSSISDLHERVLAVKMDGPTKEQYVWGFRIGCITFGIKNGSSKLYSFLEAKAAGVIRGSISCASNLSQSLILEALRDESYASEKEAKYNQLMARYRRVQTVLAENPVYEDYFKALPFNSGYFMCVRLNPPLEGDRVRRLLLEKYDTGVISDSSVIRIAFSAVPENRIGTLFNNLLEACREAAQ